jgi:hypothetical protein
MPKIPKGLYVKFGKRTYNPFGIQYIFIKLPYKHKFPSGMRTCINFVIKFGMTHVLFFCICVILNFQAFLRHIPTPLNLLKYLRFYPFYPYEITPFWG